MASKTFVGTEAFDYSENCKENDDYLCEVRKS